jgi:DNA-binding HxlR family transcriptional regulator
MRSYRQYCGLARALDIIGDRWTLLIVRELLIGELRYTDLLEGLPGIATNLLATRLTELESVGLITREVVPPPVASTVFRLTPRGEELRPVVFALGRWASPLMTGPVRGDRLRARWMALPIELYLRDRKPKARPIAIQVMAGDEPMVIETRNGEVRARAGVAAKPDAVMTGPVPLVLKVLMGKASVAQGRASGMSFEGDQKVLKRLTSG